MEHIGWSMWAGTTTLFMMLEISWFCCLDLLSGFFLLSQSSSIQCSIKMHVSSQMMSFKQKRIVNPSLASCSFFLCSWLSSNYFSFQREIYISNNMIIFISTSTVLCVIREYPALCWCYTVILYWPFFSLWFATFPVQSKWPTQQTGDFHCYVRENQGEQVYWGEYK